MAKLTLQTMNDNMTRAYDAIVVLADHSIQSLSETEMLDILNDLFKDEAEFLDWANESHVDHPEFY